MNARPNILLIVVDCLRSDSTVGNRASAQTPNIENQIGRGVLFPNCITVNSMTTPCMTSMFSGLYPHTHGVRALRYARVSDDVPLLAEILQENGYYTVGAATGPVGSYTHLDRGFSEYKHREGVSRSFLGEWGDEFIARIRSGSLPEPWFTYLHLWEVHMPRQVRAKFADPEYGRTNYDRAISTLDARLGELLDPLMQNTMVIITGDHGEKTADSGLEANMERLKAPISHNVRRRLGKRGKKAYRTLTGKIRQSWFSLARTLYRQGLISDPLGTITGHGFHVYDSLTRVPLIISGYGGAPLNQRIDQQVLQIDIMPTILDLVNLGAEIPGDLDGRSLKPLMDGRTISHVPAFIETCQNPSEPSDLYGVRTPDWKYSHHLSDPAVVDELYDLRADPMETNNVAKAHPDVVAEMKALLHEHLGKSTRKSVSLQEELSAEEMSDLAKHLEKLGYLE